MTHIKAIIAKHDDIAKTLYEALQAVLVVGVCIGTAPALIWLASIS